MDKATRNAKIRKLYKALTSTKLSALKSAAIIKRELGLEYLTLRTIIAYSSDTYEEKRKEAIDIHLEKVEKAKYFCPRTDNGETHGSTSVHKEGGTIYCSVIRENGKICFYHFTGVGIKEVEK